MSSTSTIPSPLLQRKARNTGLLYAVLLLILVGVLALRVEVFGRLDLDAQRLYFQQRAEKIVATHAKYWRQGGAMEVYVCFKNDCYQIPEHQIKTNIRPTLLTRSDVSLHQY